MELSMSSGTIVLVIAIIVVVLIIVALGVYLLYLNGTKKGVVAAIPGPTVISPPGRPPIISAPYQLPPPLPQEPIVQQVQQQAPLPSAQQCVAQEDCPEGSMCANGDCVPL
jgi:hypothetical protein